MESCDFALGRTDEVAPTINILATVTYLQF